MKGLAQLLRDNAPAYRDRVHEKLFATVYESRQIFAHSMDKRHADLAGALAWFFDHCDPWGGPQPEALYALRRLGRDHRRHGFPAEIYKDFAACLIYGLDLFDLSASDRIAGEHAIELACSELADAAREADVAGIPPAHQARVVAIKRPNREIAVVRLETSMPIDFNPGQFFPVSSSLLPGAWVQLTPAAPANAVGQLEFHIQAPTGAGLDNAAMLMRAQPGDTWTLGAPRGSFAAHAPDGSTGRRTVFLPFGTGWAAVRALMLSRVADATAATQDISLNAIVYATATSPGQHYDTTVQSRLRTLDPRFNITLLVNSPTDPWLLGAQPFKPGTTFITSPNPVAAVLEKEDPLSSYFVLVGPAHVVDEAATALHAAGVEPNRLELHPWALGRSWDPELP